MLELDNRRILIIDDNKSIHADYRKVLQVSTGDALSELEATLFGSDAEMPVVSKQQEYEIDSAFQGQEGLEKVKQAIEEDRPYALACVDVRMPPGWDGVETCQKIWEIDPELPVILCTAYSDHSWAEISAKFNRDDQFLILKKPFDNAALRQMVTLQTEKWRLSRIANLKQTELEKLVSERTRDVVATRDILFYTLAKLVESRDEETGDHLNRMQQYTRILAQWLKDNGPYQDSIDDQFVENIYRSSILHDIGKVGIPDR